MGYLSKVHLPRLSQKLKGGALKNILFRRLIETLCLCLNLLGKLKGRYLICYSEVASGGRIILLKRGGLRIGKKGLLSRNAISRVWTDTYWDRIAFYKWVVYLRNLPLSIPEIKGQSTISSLNFQDLLLKICLCPIEERES